MNDTNEKSWPKGYSIIPHMEDIAPREAKRRGPGAKKDPPKLVGYILHRKINEVDQFAGNDMSWVSARILVNRFKLFTDKQIGEDKLTAEEYALRMARWQHAQDQKAVKESELSSYPFSLLMVPLPVCDTDRIPRARRVQVQLDTENAKTFSDLQQALLQGKARMKNGNPVTTEGHVLQYVLESIHESRIETGDKKTTKTAKTAGTNGTVR